jgi:hypothetical protein
VLGVGVAVEARCPSATLEGEDKMHECQHEHSADWLRNGPVGVGLSREGRDSAQYVRATTKQIYANEPCEQWPLSRRLPVVKRQGRSQRPRAQLNRCCIESAVIEQFADEVPLAERCRPVLCVTPNGEAQVYKSR